MSGGEPLWRRVAGLYLSGIPADAKDRVSSTRARAGEGGTDDLVEDPTREIIMLGEALDLVTLAQGYRSPAVPLLLRALIRVVRELSAERAHAAVAEEAAAGATPTAGEEPAPEEAEDSKSDTRAATANGNGEAGEPGETETPHETQAAEAEAVTDRPTETPSVDEPAPTTAADSETATLAKRVTQTDRKVAALTTAVGQLVDVLQRRARNGGDIERRAAPRVPGTHATVFVHDRPYEVVNWSQGGFLIRIAETDRFSRTGFDFHFMLELPDETVEFQGRARPVRIERTTLAAEFATLDDAVAARIGEIAAGLAGGD